MKLTHVQRLERSLKNRELGGSFLKRRPVFNDESNTNAGDPGQVPGLYVPATERSTPVPHYDLCRVAVSNGETTQASRGYQSADHYGGEHGLSLYRQHKQ